MLEMGKIKLHHVAVAALVGCYLMVPQRSQGHNLSVLSDGGFMNASTLPGESSHPAGMYALFQLRRRESSDRQILRRLRHGTAVDMFRVRRVEPRRGEVLRFLQRSVAYTGEPLSCSDGLA